MRLTRLFPYLPHGGDHMPSLRCRVRVFCFSLQTLRCPALSSPSSRRSVSPSSRRPERTRDPQLSATPTPLPSVAQRKTRVSDSNSGKTHLKTETAALFADTRRVVARVIGFKLIDRLNQHVSVVLGEFNSVIVADDVAPGTVIYAACLTMKSVTCYVARR